MRFLVFNLELNEGLECAYVTGQDTDEFDGICDHLIVEHVGTGKIVGTYRLQTGASLQQMQAFIASVNLIFRLTSNWATP